MLTPHWTRPAAFVLVALLVGCGPGSSGFDIIPESAAITTALREGQCVPQPTLQICPAGVPAPGRGPEAIDTAAVGPATCSPNDASFACAVALPFTPSGFPPTAAYRLAAREPAPGQGWAVGLAVMSEGPGQPGTDAPVTVDFAVPAQPDGFTTQFAILVFLDGDGATPPRVDTLAETGADFAFVTPTTAVPPGAP